VAIQAGQQLAGVYTAMRHTFVDLPTGGAVVECCHGFHQTMARPFLTHYDFVSPLPYFSYDPDFVGVYRSATSECANIF